MLPELTSSPSSALGMVRVSNKLVQLLDFKSRGLSNRQIADMMQESYPNIMRLQNSEKFQKMWAKACENAATEVKDRLVALSTVAVDTVGDMMHVSQPARVRLSAAQDVLDRTGHGVKREQANSFQVRLEADQINVILSVARELGARPVASLDAGHVQRKLVLPSKGSAGPQQTGEPAAQADVRPPPAGPVPKDPDASASWFLQNYDWSRGVADMAPDSGPQ